MSFASPEPFASCRGKVQFADREEARMAATHIGHRADAKVVHYACRHCGGWHVGTIVAQRRVEPRPPPLRDPRIAHTNRIARR